MKYLQIFLILLLSNTFFAQQGTPIPTGVNKSDEWGMSFTLPSGWQGRATDSGYLLGSESLRGFLVILPNPAKSLQEIRTEAQKGVYDTGIQLNLEGNLESFGRNGLAGIFTGWIEGQNAKSYAISLLSPHGVGATLLFATETQYYSEAHRAAVTKIATSIRFFKPPISQAAKQWPAKLNGCRLSYYNTYNSGYGGGGSTTKRIIDLCEQGFFRYNNQSHASFGGNSGSGYTNTSGKGAGTWKVISRGAEAVLQLNFYNGEVYEYTLSSDAKNYTYLNGDRYIRTCDPNDQVEDARPNCW